MLLLVKTPMLFTSFLAKKEDLLCTGQYIGETGRIFQERAKEKWCENYVLTEDVTKRTPAPLHLSVIFLKIRPYKGQEFVHFVINFAMF